VADIVVSEFMDEAAVDWLKERFAVAYDPALVDDRDCLLAAGAGVRGLIVRNRTQVDPGLLAAFPDLRAVGRLGVGLDNIDTGACRDRDIAVLPATGGNTVSVAEYVIAAVLMLRRGAYLASDAVLSGEWPRQRLIGGEVSGATLGLVGYGAIARATAERARALGMAIDAYDPFLPEGDPAWAGATRHDDLDGLLAASDAVSLHVPLTPETRGLIGRDRLARMRPGAVLVNTARGGVVDEAALAEALRDGRLGGAALDVFEAEPLRAGSPLAGTLNLIATPHIAGVTRESNDRISWMTAENVARVLGGAA
jgi:(S)-sulfolactate dehydrogenase